MTTDLTAVIERLPSDLRNLKAQFERIAGLPPEKQPHYPGNVRPFGTGDLRHIIEMLGDAADAIEARGEQAVILEKRAPRPLTRADFEEAPAEARPDRTAETIDRLRAENDKFTGLYEAARGDVVAAEARCAMLEEMLRTLADRDDSIGDDCRRALGEDQAQ